MSTSDHVIVFYRVGPPGLIEIALRNARLHCEGCRVVHLSDSEGMIGWDDAIDVTGTSREAVASLAARDSMWGPNDSMFEKLCIARWVVIYDWMLNNRAGVVCACDSDVLLFDNPFESNHMLNADVLLSSNHEGTVAASMGVLTQEAIAVFLEQAKALVRFGNDTNGCINDMAIWTMVADRIGRVGDQNRIVDGVAWDHSMGWLGNGEWEDDGNGYKKIAWIDNRPHCRHLPTGQLVRLINLHCWGDSEWKMADYAASGGMK